MGSILIAMSVTLDYEVMSLYVYVKRNKMWCYDYEIPIQPKLMQVKSNANA